MWKKVVGVVVALLFVIGLVVQSAGAINIFTAPDQPSALKQDCPLNFKPFLRAELKGPALPYLAKGKSFPLVDHIVSQSDVVLRATVTNGSDEGIWSEDDVSVLVTARDDRGNSYASDELTICCHVGQRHAKNNPERVLVGSLRAHHTATEDIYVNMPKLPRAVRRLCFRLRLAMKAGSSWQNKNAAQACIKVARK